MFRANRSYHAIRLVFRSEADPAKVRRIRDERVAPLGETVHVATTRP